MNKEWMLDEVDEEEGEIDTVGLWDNLHIDLERVDEELNSTTDKNIVKRLKEEREEILKRIATLS
jgi:hypothetical protein